MGEWRLTSGDSLYSSTPPPSPPKDSLLPISGRTRSNCSTSPSSSPCKFGWLKWATQLLGDGGGALQKLKVARGDRKKQRSTLIENLVWVRHYATPWEHTKEQDIHGPSPHGMNNPVGKTNIKYQMYLEGKERYPRLRT